MRHAIRAVVVLMSVAGAALGKGEPEVVGFPPLFGVIKYCDENGSLQYDYYTTHTVDDSPPGGLRPVMTVTTAINDIASDKEKTPASAVRVLDLNGNRLKKADAIKRLSKGTAVVICTDGGSVGEFYRRHLNPGILVLSVPRAVTIQVPTTR